MKKIIIGLLVLGSFSAFSSEYQTFEDPSITSMRSVYGFRANSDQDALCKYLTGNLNAQKSTVITAKIIVGEGYGSVTIKRNGDVKIHNSHNRLGTKMITQITCEL